MSPFLLFPSESVLKQFSSSSSSCYLDKLKSSRNLSFLNSLNGEIGDGAFYFAGSNVEPASTKYDNESFKTRSKENALNNNVELSNKSIGKQVLNIESEQEMDVCENKAIIESNAIFGENAELVGFNSRFSADFEAILLSNSVSLQNTIKEEGIDQVSVLNNIVVDKRKHSSKEYPDTNCGKNTVALQSCYVKLERLPNTLIRKVKSEFNCCTSVKTEDVNYNLVPDLKNETFENSNNSQVIRSMFTFGSENFESKLPSLHNPVPAASKAHWAVEPFKCEHCSKEFIKKICLKFHMHNHLLFFGDKNWETTSYHCESCSDCKNIDFKENLFTKDDDLSSRQFLNSHGNVSSIISHTEQSFSRGNTERMPEEKPKAEGSVCGICNKFIKFKSNLKQHMKTHDKPQFLQCSLCPLKFRRKNQLKLHLRSHFETLPFECTFCPLKFKYQSSANNHTKTHGNSWPHQCPFCPSRFKKVLSLNRHVTKCHDLDQPYNCQFCPAKFKEKDELESHVKSHDESRPYQCLVCPSKFKSKITLQRHAKTHVQARNYQCAICSKQYKTKHDLGCHIKRIHVQTKFYQCPTCSSKFKSKFDLKTHIIRHTEIRPYQCLSCPYKAKSRGDLEKHVERHNDSRRHQCPICHAKFKGRDELNAHAKRHDQARNYQCQFCPSKFKTEASLRQHNLMHENNRRFKCSLCPKSFTRLSYVADHMGVHNGRNFVCGDCGASFRHRGNYTRHKKLHLRPDTFIKFLTCSVCREKFRGIALLKAHKLEKCHKKDQKIDPIRFECDHCKKKYHNKNSLSLHMKSKHSELMK